MKAFSRLAVLTALLFCTCPALQAQEDGLIRKLGNMLTRLNKVYDTTYVFKLDMPGVVSPTADLIWTGINLHRDISYKEGTGDFQGFSTVDTHLARRLFEKAGLGLSYGSLAFGYTVELARNGTQRNKYNNFSFVRPRFGISFQYYRIHEYMAGVYRIPEIPDFEMTLESGEPGQMRHLVVDGFYFFNPERFSYLATTGRNVVQRRSGGSWLASVCYSQGEYGYKRTDAIVLDFPDHIGVLRTGALSLGGGYSFNWVPYHRDPGGDGLDGFRNLTFNLTFVPRVTLYNHLFVTQYGYPNPDEAVKMYQKEFGHLPDEKDLDAVIYDYRLEKAWEGAPSREYSFFKPALTLSAHAGFIYSWKRYFICLTADFERFGFKGVETTSLDSYDNWLYKTVARGSFYNVTTRVQFNVRF